MLFNSIDFKAMESSLEALSIKQQVISQNMSNIETPGYKQKNVSFQNVLEDSMNGKSQDEYDFKANVTEDDNTNINVDGNNVDTDQQSVELYSTYVQHAAIVNKINATFSNFKTVASANFN
jgi:flagellar basal-body rod protein FlgB